MICTHQLRKIMPPHGLLIFNFFLWISGSLMIDRAKSFECFLKSYSSLYSLLSFSLFLLWFSYDLFSKYWMVSTIALPPSTSWAFGNRKLEQLLMPLNLLPLLFSPSNLGPMSYICLNLSLSEFPTRGGQILDIICNYYPRSYKLKLIGELIISFYWGVYRVIEMVSVSCS